MGTGPVHEMKGLCQLHCQAFWRRWGLQEGTSPSRASTGYLLSSPFPSKALPSSSNLQLQYKKSFKPVPNAPPASL